MPPTTTLVPRIWLAAWVLLIVLTMLAACVTMDDGSVYPDAYDSVSLDAAHATFPASGGDEPSMTTTMLPLELLVPPPLDAEPEPEPVLDVPLLEPVAPLPEEELPLELPPGVIASDSRWPQASAANATMADMPTPPTIKRRRRAVENSCWAMLRGSPWAKRGSCSRAGRRQGLAAAHLSAFRLSGRPRLTTRRRQTRAAQRRRTARVS